VEMAALFTTMSIRPEVLTDQRVGASQCWGTILVDALDKFRQFTII